MPKKQQKTFIQKKQTKKRTVPKNELPFEKQSKVAQKSPSISRFIPDIASLRQIIISRAFAIHVISGFLVVMIGLLGQRIYINYQIAQEVHRVDQQLANQVQFWQGIVGKYGPYRDAYYTLALLEYQRGNIKKAREYIKKVLVIDPDFAQGKAFGEKIGF